MILLILRAIPKLRGTRDFNRIKSEVATIIQLSTPDDNMYYKVANEFEIPLHLAYLMIESLERGMHLDVADLESVLNYAICRDILIPYKNKSYLFRKFFSLEYPYMKNTDDLLKWFLKHKNGLSLTEKVAILEESTILTSMGIGRTRFEQALFRINLKATKEEIENRRLKLYDGMWSASICSFIDKERGDLTAKELLIIGSYLAEDSRGNLKVAVLSSLLDRLGKIEIYFLANQINRFHDRVSRTSSLLRAFSEVFKVNYKTVERLISMHSMVDVAWLVEHDKILEQFEHLFPFRAFRPMLAAKWMQQYKFPCYVEAKYDGVRLLLHKVGDRIICYSRRRKNYMYKFPFMSALAPDIPAFSLIIDGEITAQQWTPQGVKYLNVYELNDAIRNNTLNSYRLIYVVFDILYFNGVELVNYPFEQRRQLRHHLIQSMGKSEILVREVESFEITSKVGIINTYNQYIASGYEGAIIKDPDAGYNLGKRSEAWLKLKPKETMDVAITGIVPIQDAVGIRAWGIRYAVLREDQFVNLGMIRGLDAIAGNRIAELILERGLVPSEMKMVNLGEEMESRLSHFGGNKESFGFEITPDIVITIDSLGIVRKDGKFKLRNARFLYIREDKDVTDISTYYDIYNEYMNERAD